MDWTEATGDASFDARDNHAAVAFDGKIWVIGGVVGSDVTADVWHSANGKDWTEATGDASFDARYGHAAVTSDSTKDTLGNKMWVIGGYDNAKSYNDVWHSKNGKDWTEDTAAAAFSGRFRHAAVFFKDELWVIGGNRLGQKLNDVWHSGDGVTWTEATTNKLKFTPRHGHAALVFDNKIWVIGGEDNNLDFLRDVWHSDNGRDWTTDTAAASFGAREGHAVALDGKMWILGGEGINTFSDVWHSTNGKDWSRATVSAAFGSRAEHAAVVFDNRIWLIGGNNGASSIFNDVWYSP